MQTLPVNGGASQYRGWLVLAFLLGGVFAIDCLAPLGYGLRVLYIAPLIATLWLGGSLNPLIVATLCTVMLITGHLLSAQSGMFGLDFFNRVVGIVTLWVVGALLWQRHRQAEAIRLSEARNQLLFERADEGIVLLMPDGHLSAVNEAFARMHGYTRQEALKLTIKDLDTPSSSLKLDERLQRLLAGETLTFEVDHFHKNGQMLSLEVTAGLVSICGRDYIQAQYRDISERRRSEQVLRARVRLSEYSHGHNLDELLTRTLDEAELLTGSQVGFFHFVEADQNTLALQTWSTNTLRHMCKAAGKGLHYPADSAGVWVDALRQRAPVIYNDYPGVAQRKGLPEGHAPLQRILVVPVMRHHQVVALLGMGNKPLDYTDPDVESVTRLANLAWDIVQTKRVEQELAHSRILLAEAEYVGGVGGWEFNWETKQRWWTDQTRRLYEIDSSFESREDKELEFYAPESRTRLAAAWKQAVEQGEPFDLELELTGFRGAKRTVHMAGRVDRDHCRVYGFLQDITTAKQAEQALRESEALFNGLLHSRIVGVIVADTTGYISRASDTFLTMLGYTRADLPLRWDRMTPPEWANTDQRAVELLARGEDVPIWEKEYFHKDGHPVPVMIGITALRHDPGNSICFVLDISARKRSERELQEKHAELQVAEHKMHSLRGLLPICAGCKKIRDDRNYWHQVESYIAEHSEATFTHGYCPECARIYFPGIELPDP